MIYSGATAEGRLIHVIYGVIIIVNLLAHRNISKDVTERIFT